MMPTDLKPVPAIEPLPKIETRMVEATKFLRTLLRDGAPIALTLLQEGHRPASTVLSGEDVAHTLKKLRSGNHRGYDVYITVNRVRQELLDTKNRCPKNTDIEAVHALIADFDDPALVTLEKLKGLPLPPSIIVETSLGKYQCYWLTESPESIGVDEFRAFQLRVLATLAELGPDKSVTDLRRVMRLPGFHHIKAKIRPITKEDPVSVRFVSRLREANGRRYSRAELIGFFGEPVIVDYQKALDTPNRQNGKTGCDFLAIEQINNLNDEVKGPEVLADIQSAVAFLKKHPNDPMGVKGGKGCYDNWLRVGQALASAKGTVLEHDFCEEWLSICRSSDEAKHKWDSFTADYTGYPVLFKLAASYGWQNPIAKTDKIGETPRQRALFFPLGSAKPRPVDWLIFGLIETDCIGMVYGDSGVGKTFIALDIALSIATGTPYHGKPVKQGAVFYIAGEGRNGITRRRGAWQHQRGVTTEQMAQSPIYCSDGNLILNSASAEDIIQAVSSIAETVSTEPRLVVLDTLARTMEGDENSAKDFNQYLQAAAAIQDKFQCTVLIVHHTGKDGARGARGSSAIKAGMDFSYALNKTKSGNAIVLMCEKLKDGEQPQAITYRLQPVSFETEIEGGGIEKLSSLVPVMLDEFAAAEATQEVLWPIQTLKLPNQAKNVRKLQQLLIDEYVMKRWGSEQQEDDQLLSVPQSTLERQFMDMIGKDDRRAFKRALEPLINAGVVSTGNSESLLIIPPKHFNQQQE